jgi:hypothetical protein
MNEFGQFLNRMTTMRPTAFKQAYQQDRINAVTNNPSNSMKFPPKLSSLMIKPQSQPGATQYRYDQLPASAMPPKPVPGAPETPQNSQPPLAPSNPDQIIKSLSSLVKASLGGK